MALRICASATVAKARALYETTEASCSEAARQSGLSRTSVARYAKKQGWRKKSAAAPMPSAEARDSAADLALRLWAALERRIAAVERNPESAPVRDYVALARALRDLAALKPEPARATSDIPNSEALRADLAARLERILDDGADAIASHGCRP